MIKDVVIKAENISKIFRIPHEKINSLRGVILSMLTKKNYEEFKALDDISFEIQRGEFFGIIGRNGSGKSTLLKILAGIYESDSGTIQINGRISPFLELGIGFHPELSGRDNIFLNATVLGLSQSQIEKKFKDIVEFSELERFIDQKLKNYSSGMHMRLGFSIAIHANREIFLLDEVLAVGDSNFQQKCIAELTKHKKQKRTIILVSHDLRAIRQYCDRAMLLSNGRIIAIGNPNQIISNYISDSISEKKGCILFKDEKNGNREINNIAEISNIELFDDQGISKKFFLSGKEMTIKIEYTVYQTLENPIFGIVIKNAKNQSIFLSNTEFKKIETGVLTPGKFKVSFKIKNLLTSGVYYISPAIATNLAKVIDWKEDFKLFNIIDESYDSTGLVNLEHDILLEY